MISLIIGTLGRVPELSRMLDSLAGQSERGFEVVLIDQSASGAVASVLDRYPFPISRIVTGPGLSRARNLGLAAAHGDIVGFPDDDCWYPPDLLARVVRALQAPGTDGVSFRVTDAAGRCSAGHMSAGRGVVDSRNLWRTIVSCSFFLRRQAIGAARFDERLGVGSGTRFGSGEETEFVFRLLKAGRRIVYDGTVSVFHPVFTGPWLAARAWRYGCGHGRVLALCGSSFPRAALDSAFQLGRCAQAMACLRFAKARFHLVQAIGRLAGFCVKT